MGEYLASALGDELFVIGFLHGDGQSTATLDSLFARVGRPSLLVDLRTAANGVRAGLGSSWKLRADGLRAYGLDPYWILVPTLCFDALVYTSTARAAEIVR
jgi:hypothetical protein